MSYNVGPVLQILGAGTCGASAHSLARRSGFGTLAGAGHARPASKSSNGEHRALAATDMKGDGSYFDVAESLCVEVPTARKLVKDGRAMRGAQRDFEPYVKAVGSETQPRALTLAQSLARSPEVAAERLAEHTAQMKAQGRAGPGVLPLPLPPRVD